MPVFTGVEHLTKFAAIWKENFVPEQKKDLYFSYRKQNKEVAVQGGTMKVSIGLLVIVCGAALVAFSQTQTWLDSFLRGVGIGLLFGGSILAAGSARGSKHDPS